MPASRSSISAFSMPSSDRWTCLPFSSTQKSPSAFSSAWRVNCGTMRLTCTYRSAVSSAGPEMISGVRASSIRIESTSSTIAKFRLRWLRSSLRSAMLSRR
jgi:hypothetical protein